MLTMYSQYKLPDRSNIYAMKAQQKKKKGQDVVCLNVIVRITVDPDLITPCQIGLALNCFSDTFQLLIPEIAKM